MYRVLIVEDDPMVAMINEQYVNRSSSFHVAGICRSGAEALKFLERSEVNLIVLDVYMPQMTGIETLRKIRERKITAEVIMVTAANDKETVEEAIHLGVLDYLVKPFTFERFQVALEKFEVKANALKGSDKMNQQSIDSLLQNPQKNAGELYPKGIHKQTLDLILNYLQKNKDQWLTGASIAEEVGLSSVTIRRYMNYLVENGNVKANMDYETGGRPSMLYKI